MPKVLIVDDSPAQLYSLKRIVEDGGMDTVTAESGEVALQLANSELPSVILMDIVMPGMSGFQATRKLTNAEATRDIPVIFVTSKSEESDKIWGLRQGACDYLTKPVNPNHLLTAIRDVMAA